MQISWRAQNRCIERFRTISDILLVTFSQRFVNMLSIRLITSFVTCDPVWYKLTHSYLDNWDDIIVHNLTMISELSLNSIFYHFIPLLGCMPGIIWSYAASTLIRTPKQWVLFSRILGCLYCMPVVGFIMFRRSRWIFYVSSFPTLPDCLI